MAEAKDHVKRRRPRGGAAPWLSLLVLWVAAFVLSCLLSTRTDASRTGPGGSMAAALVGDSRTALAHRFFQQADLYFHRGVEHEAETAFSDGIFQRAAERVDPTGHVHLEPDRIKEMMPWLSASLRMDPHNIENHLVTAFWLANKGGEPEIAQEILREAQVSNPRAYAIQIARGRIYLQQQQTEAAERCFSAALAFWPGDDDPGDDDARHDKAEALLYRGLLYEVAGDLQAAIRCHREILDMFPSRHGLRERLTRLERGETPINLADALWGRMLREHERTRAACAQEVEGHDHDDDHGGNCEQCQGH